MRLNIEIKSNDAELSDKLDGPHATAIILRKLAKDIDEGLDHGYLFDVNGNKVGIWSAFFGVTENR